MRKFKIKRIPIYLLFPPAYGLTFFSLAFTLLVLYLPLLAHSQDLPKVPPSQGEDFYPLYPGNFWTYRVEVEEQGEGTSSSSFLFFWKSTEKKGKIRKYSASYVLQVLSVENMVTYKVVKLKKEWISEKRPAGETDEEITYYIKGLDIVKISTDSSEVRYRFPLFVGARWGDPVQLERTDLSYFYSVEKQEEVEVPAGKFPDCFWIIYRTRPDHTIEWFYPGVGVVKREYHHHGTVLNMVENLVRYRVK